MRHTDIRKVNKAREHVQNADRYLFHIYWMHMTTYEDTMIRKAREMLKELDKYLDEVLTCQGVNPQLKDKLVSLGWVDKGNVIVRFSNPRIGWKPQDGTLIIGYHEYPQKVHTMEALEQILGDVSQTDTPT